MEELFEKLVYSHLKEYYPRTKFFTTSGDMVGSNYTWINKESNSKTYTYLFKSEQHWCAIIATKIRGKAVLVNALSILGFTVVDLYD